MRLPIKKWMPLISMTVCTGDSPLYTVEDLLSPII